MVSLVAAAALASSAYRFEAETKLDYDVNVVFEGFLPLLGGNEGKADVKMGVRVNGLEPDDLGIRSTSELTAFEISFNGGKLPLDVESAKVYFPKTTVTSTNLGKVLKSNAPELNLPVRLPGLDVRRFPDITYLPIELSGKELTVGENWKFERLFGDAPMQYDCTVLQVRDSGRVTIAVKVHQQYEVWEDETLEVVPEEKGATARVKTTLDGSGTVFFDVSKGVAVGADMKNATTSDVRDIKSGKTTTRKLNSTLKVRLKGFDDKDGGVAVKAAPSKPGTLIDQSVGFFRNVWDSGKDLWSQGVGYTTLLRATLGFFLYQMPGGSKFAKFVLGA
ncbi:MAG: hypothetical protein ACKVQS_05315 [Fimbriimonadaceae bacterium]